MEYEQVLESFTGWAIQLLKHMKTSRECAEWKKQWLTSRRLTFKAGGGEGGAAAEGEEDQSWTTVKKYSEQQEEDSGITQKRMAPSMKAMNKDLLSKWMSRQCQRKASKISREKVRRSPLEP